MPTIQVDEVDVNKVTKYLEELEYAKYNDTSSNCSCDSCAKDNYTNDKKSSKSLSRGQSHQAYKDVQYKNKTIGCCSEKSYSKYGRSNKYSKSSSGKSRSQQAYKGADYTYKSNDCCSVKSSATGRGRAKSTSGKSNQGYGDAEYSYDEIDCCSEKGPPSYTSAKTGKSYMSRSRAGSTRSTKSTKSDKSEKLQPIITLMPADIERITKKERKCKNCCLIITIIILVLLLLAAVIALIVILANANFGKCDCSHVTAAPAILPPPYVPPCPPQPKPQSCPTQTPTISWPRPPDGDTSILSPDAHGLLVYPEGRTERYLIINEAVSWDSALRRCESYDGHLAVLDSLDELEALSEELVKIPPISRGGGSFNYYVGGLKLHPTGPFFWVTSGEQVNTLMWASGEPNFAGKEEFCVAVDPHTGKGKLNDTKCTHGYEYLEGYVCEIPD